MIQYQTYPNDPIAAGQFPLSKRTITRDLFTGGMTGRPWQVQEGVTFCSTSQIAQMRAFQGSVNGFTIMVEAEQRQKGSSRKQKDHGRRVCIIPPGTPVRDAINGLDGLLIHFNDQLFADSSVARTCLNHRRSLKKCSVATFLLSALDSFRVQQIVGAIADELTCNHPERNDMIAIKILELLILCESMNSETADEEETLETHPVIEQFNNLLERNYTRERSVRYYADTLGIHPNHLNYLVKKHTRLNAKESINNRVVQRSKQLLAQSGLIIKEIAYQLGFEDPNNFSTFFQKYAGISPVAFRSASA